VYAVSRHPLDYDVKRAKHIRLDLSDKEAVKQVCDAPAFCMLVPETCQRLRPPLNGVL
jgi:hypothetical protein